MSEDDDSVEQLEHEAAETNDSDMEATVDDDDDDDEWEDVDDECLTDTGDDCDTEHIQCRVADDTASNCPDMLTGPQLIKLFRSLSVKANRYADVHTVGLVCVFCVHWYIAGMSYGYVVYLSSVFFIIVSEWVIHI